VSNDFCSYLWPVFVIIPLAGFGHHFTQDLAILTNLELSKGFSILLKNTAHFLIMEDRWIFSVSAIIEAIVFQLIRIGVSKKAKKAKARDGAFKNLSHIF
jgi:hypothetical protein